jgi:ribose transport system substrate-binding protein
MSMIGLNRTILMSALPASLSVAAQAQALKPLDSERETDRVDWSQLQAKFGAMPKSDPSVNE